jgi:hypothetical protein
MSSEGPPYKAKADLICRNKTVAYAKSSRSAGPTR